jgi:integrase/recombinase XerD
MPKPRNPSLILNLLVKMKNDNKAASTIKNYDKLLTYLDRNADLTNPEDVKRHIAQKDTGKAYKRNLIIAYALFCKHYKIEWEKPEYRQEAKSIRIPTREKLEKLISNARNELSIKLQISMETGLRPIELCNLKAKDIDLQQRVIYPTTAKYGASRTLRISPNLAERLAEHITQKAYQAETKLFLGNSNDYGKSYRMLRNRLARKLKDALLKTVRLYDFRHYFASTLYDKTKDILLVKQQMGHKKLDTTLIYTQLLNLNEDEWTCKGATTVQQATQLIENGFQYVTEMDGVKLFRKRK